MESDGRMKVKSDVILHKFVVAASLVCFILNSSVLCISCVSGQWVFGPAFCQIYGMLSQVLVAGSAWMVFLAALERGYKLLLPAEHVSTFSEINIRILVYGIYLLLFIMFTAPLYGWGEYSNFRGAVHLHVGISPGNDTTCIDSVNDDVVFENALEVIILVLNTVYECKVRFMPTKLLVLRFPTRSHLQMFYGDFTSGVFKQNVYDTFVASFRECNVTRSDILFKFQLPAEKYDVYTNVHLTFQELGICSLDYSPVNANISSWIPFSVLSTTVMPFGIAILLGLVLYRSHCIMGLRDQLSPLSLILGPLLGLGSAVPYYIVNIYNNKEIHVDYVLNVVSTVLYFSGGLWYVILSACYGCFRRRKNARRKRKASKTSLKHVPIKQLSVSEETQNFL